MYHKTTKNTKIAVKSIQSHHFFSLHSQSGKSPKPICKVCWSKIASSQPARFFFKTYLMGLYLYFHLEAEFLPVLTTSLKFQKTFQTKDHLCFLTKENNLPVSIFADGGYMNNIMCLAWTALLIWFIICGTSFLWRPWSIFHLIVFFILAILYQHHRFQWLQALDQ